MVSGSENFAYFGNEKVETKFDFSNADVSQNINRNDWGIAGGVGISFKIFSGQLFFEGRYNYGMGDFFKGEITEQSNYKPWNNRVFNLTMGYFHLLGNKK